MPCISRKATLSFRAITVTIAGLRRSDPDSSCEKYFTVSEWMAVNAFLRKPLELTKPPTVRELMISIAQLGGYIKQEIARRSGFEDDLARHGLLRHDRPSLRCF